jgi:hypothetical protein
MGILLTPVVPVFSRQAGASDEQVKRDLAELPGLLDRVDRGRLISSDYGGALFSRDRVQLAGIRERPALGVATLLVFWQLICYAVAHGCG